MISKDRVSFRDRAGVLALLAAATLLAAGNADARTENLRWSHPEPTRVAGFKVHVGASPGEYDTVLDVGRPTPNAQSVFTTSIQVSDSATVYLAVSAYASDGEVSVLSNEKVRNAPPPPDPGTDPEPDPGSDPVEPPDPGSDPGEGAFFSEDFEAESTGTYVPGWLDTQAGNSMLEDDSLFGISDLGGDRVLSTSSTEVNIHSHYVIGGSAGWSDYELRGRMRISNGQGGVGVTAYSQYAGQDVYYRLRRYQNQPFHLAMHPGISCADGSTGVLPQANAWYAYRLQVETGNTANVVRAKVWRDGDAEPLDWQANCSDARSGRPTAGRIGVWSMGPGAKYWDVFQVLPLGAAPPPGGGGEPPLEPPRAPILIP